MKEQLRNFYNNEAMQQWSNRVPNRFPLTTPLPNPHTMGGEIFMAEPGQQEGDMPSSQEKSSIENVQRPIAGKPLTPEQKDIVKKRWERDYLKGRDLSSLPFEERQAVETAIKLGVLPVAGGADPIPNVLSYTDAALQNIAIRINEEINRSGVGRPLDPVYVQRQLQEVENLVNSEAVNADEARRLIGILNGFMAEAAEEAVGRGYYLRSEEEEIRTNANGRRERIFEELFIGVDARPGIQFREALSLEQMGRADRFFTVLSQASDDPREVNRLTREFSARFEIRRILHDANWSVAGGGDIQAFANAVATYQAEYTDLIFIDPLVEKALHMFEQSFQKIKADNNGMLPYEKLEWDYKTGSSGVEDIVWDVMRRSIPSDTPGWRLRRAITLARGFGVLSLRFPEIAAEARLPEEKPGISAEAKARRIASIYGEAIARYLDPLEHSIEKFAIGGPERALLYYFLTGDKGRFESTKQIREALAMRSHLTGRDNRLIDTINLFRTGGPFSYTSWRAFTALEGISQAQLRRFGIGIREVRVSGDVDDAILEEVKTDDAWARRRDEEIAEEARRRSEQRVQGENMTYKEHLILQRRLSMWNDGLEVNPLRVMWVLETKNLGQRLSFLSEALGLPENEARQYLDEVEKNLMVIQEKFVSSRKDLGAPGEKLDFNIIIDDSQRERVIRYVEKIRDKGRENNHQLIRQILEKSPAEGSPFPFIIGMEDIPFSDFNFINTGGRSFARRISDLSGAIRASDELIGLITKFPTTQNIGPIIESLVKIKDGISFYDRSLAMEIIPFLAEGILRIYDKEVLARLPLGIGTVVSFFKDTSYAQEVLGRAAMSWTETDKYNFTRQLLQNGLVEKDKLEAIRKRVGATWVNFGVDLLRTYGQLLLLLLAYQFSRQVLAERR